MHINKFKELNKFYDRLFLAISFTVICVVLLISSLMEFKIAQENLIYSQIDYYNIQLRLYNKRKFGTKQLARITCYSWTGNPMANTLYPVEGYVATSDRTIPFGTIIIIDGKKYEVGDRTAKWVDEKYEYHTVDIYKDN